MGTNKKMNPEIRDQWVANLLSGEYKQGTSVLHNVSNNTFCCLGVLCDMAVKAGVPINDSETSEEYVGGNKDRVTIYSDSESEWTSVLPPEVQEWAGMDSDTGVFVSKSDVGNNFHNSLAALNDDGDSFTDIAQTIMENF